MNKVPLRVAFLTPSLAMGGAERWMISLAKHCDAEKIEWVGTVLTHYHSVEPELVLLMSSYMPVYGPLGGEGIAAGRITCHTSAEDAVKALASSIDVVVAWGLPNIHEYTKHLSVPVVYVSHGSGIWSEQTVRSSESGCTHFAAVSKAAISAFSDVVQPSVTVLENGIEVERCRKTMPARQFREKWGIPDDALVLGYVGRFSYEKNPLAAAQAVRQIDEPNVLALYCGDGWKSKEVISDVKSLVDGRAIFLPFHEDVGDVFNAIDVSFLPSHSEGFSLGLAESWYCGVPNVATRVGAVPELEEEYGQLVAAVPIYPTADELVCGVEEAISDAFRSDCIPRAQKMVSKEYTSERMAQRWEEYLILVQEESVKWG